MSGRDVQALIATRMLGEEAVERELGDVTLHEHQRDGADRVRHLLEMHRGALVADDVGLGKTFLALAVSRTFRNPVAVAPAALRSNWEDAARRASLVIPFISLESLARGATFESLPDLVIIDEAQHLRTATTRRYDACRALCASARVLLLSATPIQNRVDDLRNVLALFLGERAHALTNDQMSQLIVRRDAAAVDDSVQLPGAEAPTWLELNGDADCLERIVSLPPPLSAADAGDGGALLTYTLVRQWASSRAALRSALTRRIARACALEDSLLAGRMPTRAELGAWTFSGGSQQLAFPLFAATAITDDADTLLARVRRHRDAVRELAAWLGTIPDPDVLRAGRIRELMTRHPGRRIIAFSEFADTIAALYRLLAPCAQVAMLTHAGGRVSSGRASRRDLIASFAPGARDRTHERERVDLLLATDVLSEGVGLHDASVVIHLDIPWNPARLAQRVGRVRRLGATESSVLVYAMRPPAAAARMLEVESRLRRKIDDAARVIGVCGELLPGVGDPDAPSVADRAQRRAALLRAWRGTQGVESQTPAAGAVYATRAGVLVCLRINGIARLLVFDGQVTEDSATADALMSGASTESAAVDQELLRRVTCACEAFLARRAATDVVDLQTRRVAQHRRELLRRTERIARGIPRHARASVSPMLFAARNAAAAPLSAGAERVLEELTHAHLSDEAWLRALGEFASLHAIPKEKDGVIAVLLLVPS